MQTLAFKSIRAERFIALQRMALQGLTERQLLLEEPVMAEAKTNATNASIESYIEARASASQRADCLALMSLFGRVTGEPPKMWGPSIVGYGSYAYTYESGRTGESCMTGFAIRGKDLVVYLVAEGENQSELLSRLGQHKIGKACLYFKRLADLDLFVLESLITGSLAELRRRYPSATLRSKEEPG
jgi:Domain of unknown function (DU1801)